MLTFFDGVNCNEALRELKMGEIDEVALPGLVELIESNEVLEALTFIGKKFEESQCVELFEAIAGNQSLKYLNNRGSVFVFVIVCYCLTKFNF